MFRGNSILFFFRGITAVIAVQFQAERSISRDFQIERNVKTDGLTESKGEKRKKTKKKKKQKKRKRACENTYLEEAHNLESGAHPRPGTVRASDDLSNWRAGTPDYAIDSWRVFARPEEEEEVAINQALPIQRSELERDEEKSRC